MYGQSKHIKRNCLTRISTSNPVKLKATLGAWITAGLLTLVWPMGFLLGADTTRNILPLAQVKPGMKGIGKTVFIGNKIEEFNVEILGVLENIAPKQSAILARLS